MAFRSDPSGRPSGRPQTEKILSYPVRNPRGINFPEITRLAHQYGIASMPLKLSTPELLRRASPNHPAIIQNQEADHFYVCTGLLPSGEVGLIDPMSFRHIPATPSSLDQFTNGHALFLKLANGLASPTPPSKIYRWPFTAGLFLIATGAAVILSKRLPNAAP